MNAVLDIELIDQSIFLIQKIKETSKLVSVRFIRGYATPQHIALS